VVLGIRLGYFASNLELLCIELVQRRVENVLPV